MKRKEKDIIDDIVNEGSKWSEQDCKLYVHVHNTLKNNGCYNRRDKRIMDELRESVRRLEK